MAVKKRGLGRGLDALFGEDSVQVSAADKPAEKEKTQAPAKSGAKPAEKEPAGNGEVLVRTSYIVPNAGQPRKNFDKEALEELTESVKLYGVLQPLIVKAKGARKYEIIAGERRWRAAQAAGLKEVPVVIRDYDDQKTMEISIIENLQREDLNSIEEAKAYEQLMKDFGLSQEQVAEKVSKNRTTITNSLRLLKLAQEVQQMVIEGKLSGGLARALISIEDKEKQIALALEAAETHMSVREAERKVKALLSEKPDKKEKKKAEERDLSLFYKAYEEKMGSAFGTKVRINGKNKDRGRIEIDYYSQDELERLMELISSIGE